MGNLQEVDDRISRAMTTKVLIIDDEDMFREDFAELLRQRGYECRTASDGEKGLALAEEFGPDVIFCNVIMPGRGGIEILAEIIQICPESFVITLTACEILETMIEALQKGASAYVTKPLQIEDIFQKIDHFMECKRPFRRASELRVIGQDK